MNNLGDIFTALLEKAKFNPWGNFVSRAHSNNYAFTPNFAAGPLGGIDQSKFDAKLGLREGLDTLASRMRRGQP